MPATVKTTAHIHSSNKRGYIHSSNNRGYFQYAVHAGPIGGAWSPWGCMVPSGRAWSGLTPGDPLAYLQDT